VAAPSATRHRSAAPTTLRVVRDRSAAELIYVAGRPPADPPAAALLPPTAPPAQAVAMKSRAPKPTAAPTRNRPAEPTGTTDDERRPGAPVGPPGQTFFATGAAPPAGGAAAGLWCVILMAALVCASRELRRHRLRFILLEPTGFVSPQQRPG
jgi:hypothetical protein